MEKAVGNVRGPVDASDRSALLDSLRGWALFGILIANMVIFTGFAFVPEEERARLLLSQHDDIAELLVEWLVIGKFYALFSLLFGIGFAIQIGRLEQRGEGAARYVRRLGILFLLGLAHMLLLWMGDILALYAVMGAVLLLFRRVRDRTLLLWAAALWVAPILWAAAGYFEGFRPDAAIFETGVQAAVAAGVDFSRGPLGHYQSADLLAHLRAHPSEMLLRFAMFVEQLRFTKVLGMFLVGLWIGRRAIHANPEAWKALLRRAALIGLGLGLPLSLVKAILLMWPGDPPLARFAAEIFYCLGTPTLALGYAAGFTLLWLGTHQRLVEAAAPAGRMALTNYLGQTVVQSVIFYGWGIGLMGKLGLVFIVPIATALFAIQIVYSRWWLHRFRFGPVEWLWRSLTYGRWQPMRRNDGTGATPSST